MFYTLILFVSIGAMSEQDSMALTNVVGFHAKETCEVAGKAAVQKFGIGTKRADYICVQMRPT